MKRFRKTPSRPMQLWVITLVLFAGTFVYGSHHFETELSKKYPAFDVTDAFVFESATPGFTTFVMHVNPEANKEAKEIFGSNGLYNLHIAFDDTFAKGVTYTVKFDGQSLELGKIDNKLAETQAGQQRSELDDKIAQANAGLGQQGTKIGTGSISQTATFDNGIKMWAGLARDPFMGNAVGLAAFKGGLNEGKFDVHAFDNAEDFFADRMVGSIVLEIPNQMLSEEVRYFVTSAMKLDGEWQQINRAANVLITHLFFGNNTPEIYEHIHHRPDTDGERKYVIANTVLRAVSLAKTKDDPVAYADKVANMFMPDVLTYKVGTPAEYGIENRNGRKLSDDGMDTVLSIFSGTKVTDHANTSDRYQAAFPYVVPVK